MMMSESTFHINVLSPDAKLFSGPATAVAARGSLGELTILKDHAPLITVLDEGTVRIRQGSREVQDDPSFTIASGFMMVYNNQVTILKSV